ncbi:hypothetical protein [Spirillospora sp. NPDC047279]|uniref:hypothetical protein n=1 Tax=Spirillospora sp. NPDC047279 TaxID=3155478 RepID=UPI0033DB7768
MNVQGRNDAERRVVAAVRAGEPADLRAGDAGQTGDAGQDDPERGDGWGPDRTIRAGLLIELLTARPDGHRPRPIKLRGVRVTGTLGLEAAELVRPVSLRDCHIDEPVDLSEASAPAIRMPGSYVPALHADQLRTAGNLDLDGAVIGRVSLVGARIGGRLSLKGARLHDHDGVALRGDGLDVGEGVFMRDGFTAQGEISIAGARVGGRFSLAGAHLANPGGRALNAERLDLDHDLRCCDGFTSRGEIRLVGARIGGQFELDGAHLSNPGAVALHADALTVGQSVFGRRGLVVEGELRLVGARVGGVRNLTGATLRNPSGRSFHAVRMNIGGDLHLRRGFTSDGELQLSGITVGGQVELNDSVLANPGGQALDLESATAAALLLVPRRSPDGVVNLTNARVGIFEDAEDTWPARARLEGFVYETLADDRVGVRARLRWLARQQDGYAPRVYDQLAAACRRAGREEAARKVLIAKQWRRRRMLGPPGRLTNWLLYVTVGYGYRTRLAALWLAALLATGTWGFEVAYPDAMVRVDPKGPAFHAFGYTLDVLLPIVDIGQQKTWRPQGAAMYWSWTLVAAGWILTTAVVAGLTATLRRD